eukprot:TRINITY_DN109865_c0_g1_i1.p1 TRINITY_DN109865_c0_g1~~TRINITY_DN109865_c0_g1_i1.p1  ORF type:complete len:162 (+),score=28.65 TRINITY_DN109865_c0_g1_i1:33-488(+)
MLFLPDQLAAGAYLVSKGRVQYSRELDDDRVVREWVDADEDWISEHVLWTDSWYHVGGSQAHTECEFLMVMPKAFEDIVSPVKGLVVIVKSYAKKFMQWVEQSELNDVIQGDQVGDVIHSFIDPAGDLQEESTEAIMQRSLRGRIVPCDAP